MNLVDMTDEERFTRLFDAAIDIYGPSPRQIEKVRRFIRESSETVNRYLGLEQLLMTASDHRGCWPGCRTGHGPTGQSVMRTTAAARGNAPADSGEGVDSR